MRRTMSAFCSKLIFILSSLSRRTLIVKLQWQPRARPGCATHHKLGIQRCKDRASRQIATLYEQVALFEHSLRKVAALTRYQSVRSAWTTAVLEPRCRRYP